MAKAALQPRPTAAANVAATITAKAPAVVVKITPGLAKKFVAVRVRPGNIAGGGGRGEVVDNDSSFRRPLQGRHVC